MNETRENILTLLKEIKPAADFASSTDFIGDFLLDSFDVITLCDLIEERFGKEIATDDITAENFSSLEAIAALVEAS